MKVNIVKIEEAPNKQAIITRFKSQRFQKDRMIIASQMLVRGMKKITIADISFMMREMPIRQVKILTLDKIYLNESAVQQLTFGDWPSLQKLFIFDSEQFGDGGSRQIALLRADNLKQFCVFPSNIGADGCIQLTKVNWKQLSVISFIGNPIGNQGCRHIGGINQNITQLNLSNCGIREGGVKLLSNEIWKNLSILSLSQNQIGDSGCKWLSHSKWDNLQQLTLSENKIAKAGCRWLFKANWKQLTLIWLSKNKIFWEGCSYLNRSDWSKLNSLNILNEGIKDNGYHYLMTSNWKNIHLLHKSEQDHQESSKTRFSSAYIN